MSQSRRKPLYRRGPRQTVMIIITLCLLLGLAAIRPEQLQVILYKTGLVTLAVVIGYWADRSVFLVEARPHECIGGIHIVGAWIRRAMIVGAVVLGMTLGL
ncbi:putative 2/3 transmembrane domain holin [compost metagenome]